MDDSELGVVAHNLPQSLARITRLSQGRRDTDLKVGIATQLRRFEHVELAGKVSVDARYCYSCRLSDVLEGHRCVSALSERLGDTSED